MEHLIDIAAKITWPGALVLVVLIIAVAACYISIFGEWPQFGKRK